MRGAEVPAAVRSFRAVAGGLVSFGEDVVGIEDIQLARAEGTVVRRGTGGAMPDRKIRFGSSGQQDGLDHLGMIGAREAGVYGLQQHGGGGGHGGTGVAGLRFVHHQIRLHAPIAVRRGSAQAVKAIAQAHADGVVAVGQKNGNRSGAVVQRHGGHHAVPVQHEVERAQHIGVVGRRAGGAADPAMILHRSGEVMRASAVHDAEVEIIRGHHVHVRHAGRHAATVPVVVGAHGIGMIGIVFGRGVDGESLAGVIAQPSERAGVRRLRHKIFRITTEARLALKYRDARARGQGSSQFRLELRIAGVRRPVRLHGRGEGQARGKAGQKDRAGGSVHFAEFTTQRSQCQVTEAISGTRVPGVESLS